MVYNLVILGGVLLGSGLYKVLLHGLSEFTLGMHYSLLACVSISFTQIVIKKLTDLRFEIHTQLMLVNLVGIPFYLVLMWQDDTV